MKSISDSDPIFHGDIHNIFLYCNGCCPTESACFCAMTFETQKERTRSPGVQDQLYLQGPCDAVVSLLSKKIHRCPFTDYFHLTRDRVTLLERRRRLKAEYWQCSCPRIVRMDSIPMPSGRMWLPLFTRVNSIGYGYLLLERQCREPCHAPQEMRREFLLRHNGDLLYLHIDFEPCKRQKYDTVTPHGSSTYV